MNPRYANNINLKREAKRRQKGDVPLKNNLLDSGATGITALIRRGWNTRYIILDQVNTSLTFTSEEFREGDELTVYKQSELGELTLTGTQNITFKDGSTSLSYTVADGTSGWFTLIFEEGGESYMIENIETASSGGGSSVPAVKLAPDLNFISNNLNSETPYQRVAGIDGSSGLATALSLSGKYIIDMLGFDSVNNESVTVKLTIDGVVIINDTFTVTGNDISIVGGGINGAPFNDVSTTPIYCETSLLLEISTTTDTNVGVVYSVRPIV